MRLLNASTFKVVNFGFSQKVPPYAILSHTWEEDEVTFCDFQNDTATTKSTWKKVWNACQRTIKDGLEYIWIDSCCIKRTSTSELDEVINSMFAWYEGAMVCYGYLSDVSVCNSNQRCSAFERSRWFTRGWTLQELIAPANVIFFSQDWTELGCKNSLCGILSKITRIDEDILMHRKPVQSASVAQRMSWAAYRETTRSEDIAYCLLGIFSVNMQHIYGERGERAFMRLQEHIMKHTYDHSIFAWTDSGDSGDNLHGMLATSPSKFADCHDIFPIQEWSKRQYSLTNIGLHTELPIIAHDSGNFIARLGCGRKHHRSITYVGIVLKRLSQDRRQYARIKGHHLEEVSEGGTIQTINVSQNHLLPDIRCFSMDKAFELRQMPGSPYQISSIFTQTGTELTLHKTKTPLSFEIDKEVENHLQCCITIEQRGGPSLLLMLGTMEESAVGFDAIDAYDPSMFDVEDFETVRNFYSPIEFGSWIRIQNHFVRVDAEIQVWRSHKYYVLDVKVHPVTGQQSWNKPSLVYMSSRPAIRPKKALAITSNQAYNRQRLFVIIIAIAMLVMVEVTRFCYERKHEIT